MRVAICLFGQPRFYKESVESFRQEFYDMPGHDVDVFMHAWSEIGLTSKDDMNKTNKKNDINEIKNELWDLYEPDKGHLGLVVEDPEESFGKTADSFAEVIRAVRDNKLFEERDWGKHLGKVPIHTSSGKRTFVRIRNGQVFRYELGQYYSLHKAIEMKAWHEKQNNFEYDLVIKVRTDSIFIPKEIYTSEEEYYEDKEKFYFNFLKDNKRGISGLDLNLLIGLSRWPKPSISGAGQLKTGWPCFALDEIEIQDGKIVKIKPRDIPPEEKGDHLDMYKDYILNENGSLAFPFQIYQQDTLLFADSQSANKAWATMLSTYTSLLCNDISRFIGRKYIGRMPCGEVIAGASGVLNDVNLYRPPDIVPIGQPGHPEGCARYDTFAHLRNIRMIKLVHPDASKRKPTFRSENKMKMTLEFLPADSHQNMINHIKSILK